MLSKLALTFVALGPSAFAWQSASGYGFFVLPELPGGDDISYAYSISADGATIAGESYSAITLVHGEGVRWSRAGSGWVAQPLGLPPTGPAAWNTPSLGLASDASVLVGRVSFDPVTSPLIDTLAYVWSASGGMQLAPNLAGDVIGSAQCATSSGALLVGWGSAVIGYAHPHPVVWSGSSASGWTAHSIDPGIEGMALRVDPAARAIVGWARPTSADSSAGLLVSQHPVCWRSTSGGSIGAGSPLVAEWLPAWNPADPYGQAHALAGPGASIVAGFSGDPARHAEPVLWTRASGSASLVRSLGTLPGLPDGSADALSASGRRAVGSCYGLPGGQFVSDAFVWDATRGLRSVQGELLSHGIRAASGWALTGATGISADGHVICGYGIDPKGRESSWVATLP